jgi:hypothetical protein
MAEGIIKNEISDEKQDSFAGRQDFTIKCRITFECEKY